MASRTFNPQMSSSLYGQNSGSIGNSNPPAGIIQLESWSHNLASLNPHQKQSVEKLNDWLRPKPGLSYSALEDGRRKEEDESSRQRQDAAANQSQPLSNGDTNLLTNDSARPELNETVTVISSKSTDASSSAAANFQSLPTQPLTDSTSFLSYYSALTTHLSNSTKSSHETALTHLTRSTQETEDLLLEFERVKVNLAELKAGMKAVEEADGLREKAEGMLERMDHLQNLSSSLSLRLSYFDILQPSTILLSSPSLSLVQSPDFLHMLDRLDIALAFVRAHPHYRDSNLYKMRFEGCLIRAGTLIRMWVMGKVKEVGNTASMSMGQKDGKDLDLTSVSTTVHSNFESLGRDARNLISEVEKRAHPNLGNDYSSEEISTSNETKEALQRPVQDAKPELILNPNAPEFISLLSEIRISYLSTRKSLLLPLVQSQINKIASDLKESKASHLSPEGASDGPDRLGQLRSLILKGFEYLDSLGRIEREIYGLYFNLEDNTGTNRGSTSGPIQENRVSLRLHLEELSEPLYGILRPKIQKENEVDSLASICSVLLDLPSSSSSLIKPFLKEVQNRLLTRAQSICKSEIQDFKAKEGELDYPRKLHSTRETDSSASEASKAQHRKAKSSLGGAGLLEAAAEAEAIERNEKTSTVRLFASPSPQVLSTWYPPLVKLLFLLSTLHQKVPTSIFTKFATSSINICRTSLARDYESLCQSLRMGENGYDPPLFYLRHLFLLREMVTSVELSARSEQTSNSKADWLEGEPSQTDSEGRLSTASALSFSTVVDAINSLWSTAGVLFYPKNFYDLAARATNPASQGLQSGSATPIGDDESFKKPLSALEKDIQRASTKLVDLVAAGSVLPLKMFLDHASVKQSQLGREQQYLTSEEISSKPETSVDRAKSAAEGFKTSSESTLTEAVECMRNYLEDEKVVNGILMVILQRILSTYSPFRKLILSTYRSHFQGKELLDLLPEDELLRGGLEKKFYTHAVDTAEDPQI